jgi:hypothetical protein
MPLPLALLPLRTCCPCAQGTLPLAVG